MRIAVCKNSISKISIAWSPFSPNSFVSFFIALLQPFHPPLLSPASIFLLCQFYVNSFLSLNRFIPVKANNDTPSLFSSAFEEVPILCSPYSSSFFHLLYAFYMLAPFFTVPSGVWFLFLLSLSLATHHHLEGDTWSLNFPLYRVFLQTLFTTTIANNFVPLNYLSGKVTLSSICLAHLSSPWHHFVNV